MRPMEKQARQDVDLFGYEKMVEGSFCWEMRGIHDYRKIPIYFAGLS
jgi:hypothetical protein